MFSSDEIIDTEEFKDLQGDSWVWNSEYQAYVLKDTVLVESESRTTNEIEEDEDMQALTSLTANQDAFKGTHCALCNVGAEKEVMCAVDISTSKLVSFGSMGSRIECLSSSDCKDRRSGNKSTNKYSTTGQSTFNSVPKCRHAATQAYDLEGIGFYGGSQWRVEDVAFDQKEWLVVSLLGYKASYSTSSGAWSSIPNWNQAFKPFSKIIHPQVTIDWPDMGVPPLKPGFWDKLLSLAKKQGYKNVLFYCVGGHGRTGTALSSILVECSGLTPNDAILFVRDNYCKEAVESNSQVKYLEQLYETNTKEKK